MWLRAPCSDKVERREGKLQLVISTSKSRLPCCNHSQQTTEDQAVKLRHMVGANLLAVIQPHMMTHREGVVSVSTCRQHKLVARIL